MASKKRILIIDDDTTILSALRTLLKERGHEVDTCETGGAGLERLKEGRYDLIFLDYGLPDMDGLRVAQKISEMENNEATIVFISGHRTSDVILGAVRLGAFDFIGKPLHGEQIFSAIERWGNINKKSVEKTMEKIRKAFNADLNPVS